jgi:precorrin-2 dehydrogenase/sirohydrochlorin ferrochelatase
LNGEQISAVVVGAGEVGTRKTVALIESGASVRVIAPHISQTLAAIAATNERLFLVYREYRGASDLADAQIVFAATDSEVVNLRVANDAHELRRLVNVVSNGNEGSFTSMAVHRAGQLTIGVAAGGVPAEAARIRDEIGRSYDAEYAASLDKLASLRRQAKETMA